MVDSISFALDMMMRDIGRRIRAWAIENGMLEMVDGKAAIASVNHSLAEDSPYALSNERAAA